MSHKAIPLRTAALSHLHTCAKKKSATTAPTTAPQQAAASSLTHAGPAGAYKAHHLILLASAAQHG